jgi:glycosyltransferase involved in cell wall biosynthesis
MARAFDGRRLEVETVSNPVGLAFSLLAVTRFLRIRRFARRFRPDVVCYPGGHVWKLFLDSIPFRLLTWSRRSADGYVLLSRSLRDDFVAQRRLDPARVTVIPHGVFDDYPTVRGGPTQLAARMGIPDAEVGTYVLFVGSILSYKGIGTLLRAYGMLAPGQAGPLVIAGSGELSEVEQVALEALAGRREWGWDELALRLLRFCASLAR